MTTETEMDVIPRKSRNPNGHQKLEKAEKRPTSLEAAEKVQPH
jgi:hypothetical protein